MTTEGDLKQEDIGYLFSLSHGELMKMPRASADRLRVWELVEPVSTLDGAKVIGMKNYNVDITRKGVGMLTAVRAGVEDRFFEPRS